MCGLTTEAIASAFLTSPTTMAQRIVRASEDPRRADSQVPERSALPERLDAVLRVVYLVYNEGYSASSGESLTRADLSMEAIRPGRLLAEILPEPEVLGLLALMLLHESRRPARMDEAGELVLLENQDRSQWDRAQILGGKRLLDQALSPRSAPTRFRLPSQPFTDAPSVPKRIGIRLSGSMTCCCGWSPPSWWVESCCCAGDADGPLKPWPRGNGCPVREGANCGITTGRTPRAESCASGPGGGKKAARAMSGRWLLSNRRPNAAIWNSASKSFPGTNRARAALSLISPG